MGQSYVELDAFLAGFPSASRFDLDSLKPRSDGQSTTELQNDLLSLAKRCEARGCSRLTKISVRGCSVKKKQGQWKIVSIIIILAVGDV